MTRSVGAGPAVGDGIERRVADDRAVPELVPSVAFVLPVDGYHRAGSDGARIGLESEPYDGG